MNRTYEITNMLHARSGMETELTICTVDDAGRRDEFETVRVAHDPLGTTEEAMDDITDYINQRQEAAR